MLIQMLVSVAHWHSARWAWNGYQPGLGWPNTISRVQIRVVYSMARPGFNPQTRLNKLFHDYWRACFEINFSDRQEGLTMSSIICDRYKWLWCGYGG